MADENKPVEVPADFTPRSAIEVINMMTSEKEEYNAQLEEWNKRMSTTTTGAPKPEESLASESNVDEGTDAESPASTEESGENAEAAMEEDSQSDHARKSRTQKRIDQLVKQKNENARELERVRAERDRATQNSMALFERVKALEAEAKKIGPAPVRDDFETHDDFIEAKLDHTQKITRIEATKEAVTVQAVTEGNKVKEIQQQYINKQFEIGRQKYKDFDAVMSGIKPGEIPGTFVAEVQSQPEFVDLAYYFAKNPSDAKAIAAIQNPTLRGIEIGRVKEKLAAVEQQRRVVSNAPKPVESLKGGSPSSKSPDQMTMEEYVLHMNREDLKKKGVLPK